MTPSVQFETAGVAAGERIEGWLDASTSLFVPLALRAPAERPFGGRIRGAALGPLRLSEIEATPHLVERTSRLARATDGGHYKLSLMLGGSALVVQDGREAVLRAGDLAIYDCARPYTLVGHDGFHMVVCRLPHELFPLSQRQVAGITATCMAGDQGLAWALAPFLRRLVWVADDDAGQAADTGRLVDSVLELIGSLCFGRLSRDERGGPQSAAAVVARMKAYAEARLGDPQLTPARIAAAHHVSTRYLHKLFAREGVTPARWIRELRLERCRADLADPALRHESVTWIAARWGFLDPAHFSRTFRAAFGCSPRDYRHAPDDAAEGPMALSAKSVGR